ncbi:MAG: Sec-independent protein translocase protein TatB [Pseudomonadota bacterium]
MFDIGGVELMLVAAVAILIVGPRELPGMLRAVGRFVRQARQMTNTVQRQFNDALKEAELDDVKKTIDDVRSLNPATQIKRTIAKEMKPLTEVSDSLKSTADEAKVSNPAKSVSSKAETDNG